MNANNSTVAGGAYNQIASNASNTAIGGGQNNTIAAGAANAVIPGGYNNSVAAPGGFAAGRDAHVASGHAGSFLWGDGTGAAYSTGSNRFEALATGGARFYTGNNSLTAIQGTGSAAPSSSTAIYGIAFDLGGMGVVGIADNRNDAIGVWGRSYQGVGGYFSGGSRGIVAMSSGGLAGYFSGPVQVNGDGTFTGNAAITGNATIGGIATITGDANINGNASISGTATLGTISLAPPAVLNFGNSTRQMINLYNHDYAIGVQANAEYFRSAGGYYWFNGGSHNGTNGNPGAGGSTLLSLDAGGNATFGGTITANTFGETIGIKTSGSLYGLYSLSTSPGYAGYFMGRIKVSGDASISGSTSISGGMSISGDTSIGGSVTTGDLNVMATSSAALNFGDTTRQMINLYDVDFGIGVQDYTEYFRTGWSFAWYKGGVHDNTETNAGGGTRLMYLNQDGLGVNGTVTCNILTLIGGADLAEPFEMSTPQIPEGAVVVIDAENPGHLKLSQEPYDTRVAGIVSGAQGVKPGIQMKQQGLLEGGQNVALSGRVYVRADASNGSIKPGDLLTTASLPGYAMRVTDHARAQGAILGKAMTGLATGQGTVLVLVTLQ